MVTSCFTLYDEEGFQVIWMCAQVLIKDQLKITVFLDVMTCNLLKF
jgi:hypothetical protein